MFSLSSNALRAVRVGVALTAFVALPGCSSFSPTASNLAYSISPYRMEVVQGNFVSKEQVEVLKPGMTRTQVRDILGTALVASVFHSNRWDYVFTLRRAGVLTPPRKLTVFFADDLLQRFEGDEMPSEAEFVTQLESSRKLGKIPLLTASPEVLSKFSPSTKVLTPAETKLPSTGALATTYPPLESPAQ